MKRNVIAMFVAAVAAVSHAGSAAAQQEAGATQIALPAPVAAPFASDGSVLRSTSLAGWRGAARSPTAYDGRAALVSHAGRNGAIAGGLLGAAGGAFAGWVLNVACEYECDGQAHDIGGGALLGAGAGVLVGWGLGEAWHAIHR